MSAQQAIQGTRERGDCLGWLELLPSLESNLRATHFFLMGYAILWPSTMYMNIHISLG